MYFFSTGFGTNLGSFKGSLSDAKKVAARIARDYGEITIFDFASEKVAVVS